MSGFADLFDINKGDTEVPTFFQAKPKNPNKNVSKIKVITANTDFRGLCSPPTRAKNATKQKVIINLIVRLSDYSRHVCSSM